MAKTINVGMNIMNIGPHENLSFVNSVSALQMGIYANNGSGKTFISRMFRLLETQESEFEKVENLLTLNKPAGSFSFMIHNADDKIKTERNVSIDISRDREPEIRNDSDYKFHVFNSDYVYDNIAASEYEPDGNIEGYILGKAQIDVSTEKKEQKNVQQEQDTIENQLNKEIGAIKSTLDGYGISKKINEYKQIDFDTYITNEQTISETFEYLSKEQKVLRNLPELTDVNEIPVLPEISDTDKIKEILETAYTINSISEDFKKKLQDKQNFIELGLSYYVSEKKICPFCNQELDDNAKTLIDKYTEFINDEESKTRKMIDHFVSRLGMLQDSCKDFERKCSNIVNRFNDNKKYFPSQQTEVLDSISVELYCSNLNKMVDELLKKKSDLSVQLNIDSIIELVKQNYKNITDLVNADNIKIMRLNQIANNSHDELLYLNRKLCTAAMAESQKKNKEKIAAYLSNKQRLFDIEQKITVKESKAKASKKEKVIETLKQLLNYFFREKYTLDERTFNIKFQDEAVGQRISHILSDGEKNIVAFCYYLAEIYKLVNYVDDYKKLFFIIDDPISSMDFHYVYDVSQIIRDLPSLLNIEKKKCRYLILSHNTEFITMLSANNIVSELFILENKELNRLKNELTLPYESHLRDVYKVSKGLIPSSHTTPNSIRHVLETINKFEAPTRGMETFFKKEPNLQKNSYIYSIMEDESHGRIREQQTWLESDIKEGCEAVISYIHTKYPGQIEKIKNDIQK